MYCKSFMMHTFGPFKSGRLVGKSNFFFWLYELNRYFDAIKLKHTLTTDETDKESKEKALELIRFYIVEEQQPIVAECATPMEAICQLKVAYFPNTLANHSQIRARIAELKHGGVGYTEKFLYNMANLFQELRSSGALANDREVMATIYYKLSPEFIALYPQLDKCTTFFQFNRILIAYDRELVWNHAEKEHQEFELMEKDPYLMPYDF